MHQKRSKYLLISYCPQILAEKVRAIYSRNKSRDLYDVYFILNRNKLQFDFDIINKKLGNVKFSNKAFEDKIGVIGPKLWKEELSQTIVNLPTIMKL